MDMSGGWWVVAVLMMVVMMGGMLWMMIGMTSGHGDESRPPRADPLEIARERFARGEIDEDEFRQIRRALEEADGNRRR